MKNFYLILGWIGSIFLLGSCAKNDPPAQGDQITGKWQTTMVKGKLDIYGVSEMLDENVEKSNLVYEFKADGTFTSGGTIDPTGTVTKESISGKYTVTGTQLKLFYRKNNQQTDTVDYYNLGLTGSGMTWQLTKQLFSQAVTESDPKGDSAFLIAFIGDIDLTFSFRKI